VILQNVVAPPFKAYPVRLGAIELIELGSARRALTSSNRPFLAARYPRPHGPGPALGQLDFLASVGSFLSGAFEFLFKNLATLVNVPLDLASKGVGVLFDGLAGFLSNIPVIGVLASELLLVGKAVIQFGLSVPGLLLKGIGNVFGEVKKALDVTKTPDQKKADEKKANENILNKAQQKGGDPLKNAVQQALLGNPPSNTTPPPANNQLPAGVQDVGAGLGGTDLSEVLKVGLPIAGATALVFMLVG
jgi:hypothetical protein